MCLFAWSVFHWVIKPVAVPVIKCLSNTYSSILPMSIAEQLVEMGFEPEKAELAGKVGWRGEGFLYI